MLLYAEQVRQYSGSPFFAGTFVSMRWVLLQFLENSFLNLKSICVGHPLQGWSAIPRSPCSIKPPFQRFTMAGLVCRRSTMLCTVSPLMQASTIWTHARKRCAPDYKPFETLKRNRIRFYYSGRSAHCVPFCPRAYTILSEF